MRDGHQIRTPGRSGQLVALAVERDQLLAERRRLWAQVAELTAENEALHVLLDDLRGSR
jgi:hypothetical protein